MLVEDNLPLARVYTEYLKPEDYDVIRFEKGAEALMWLRENKTDAMLLDLNLPDMNGLDLLHTLRKDGNDVEVLIITANGSVDIAVAATRAGAADFLEKPFNAERLRMSLANVLRKNKLAKELSSYRETFNRNSYCGFIGNSLAMQAVYHVIESAAPSKAAVFITGESGTGKEVCAEALHRESKRSEGPFVALNCAAIPRDLMESEIFGHVKGAFTGAHSDRVGAAAQADGGTLFLDEVCEMDLDLQSKLLRFIQTNAFQKIGGGKLEKVDIRIVCATNRAPLAEVEAGRFREDLYYRLHVIPIHLPPLRDRDQDVIEIAEHFLSRCSEEEGKLFSGFDDGARNWLFNQSWPGNVRQLQNTLHNIVVLNQGPLVTGQMLSVTSAGINSPSAQAPETPGCEYLESGIDISSGPIVPLRETERLAIEQAIEKSGGNVPLAAALLEVSASTLYRKIRRWNSGNDRVRLTSVGP